MDKLVRAQNEALRAISGQYWSTPLEAFYLESRFFWLRYSQQKAECRIAGENLPPPSRTPKSRSAQLVEAGSPRHKNCCWISLMSSRNKTASSSNQSNNCGMSNDQHFRPCRSPLQAAEPIAQKKLHWQPRRVEEFGR